MATLLSHFALTLRPSAVVLSVAIVLGLGLLAPSIALADHCQPGYSHMLGGGCVQDYDPDEGDENNSAAQQNLEAGLTAAQDTAAAGLGALANMGFAALLSPFVIMAFAVFKIAALFLGLAGILFNWAVALLVFQFANFLGNTPGMLVAWGILRDFGNIALIFGFVFMGIATILDLHSYPWKKSLPALVIAAVLINFSLFAAEAVIDASNVLAATLYNSALAERTQCNAFSDLLGCLINNGIAGQILSQVNVQSVYGQGSTNLLEEGMSFARGVGTYFTDPLPFLLKYVGLSIVLLVAAFVLFAGAFMLISRAVILAFLMVTSPIGFAGMAVPPLKKLADDWWSKLLHQAFFAPIFLLLLLVSLKITEGLSQISSGEGGIGGAIAAGNSINTGPLIMFCLIIGFFLGALTLANRFGIYFSDLATTTAGRLSFGAMGMLGRNSVGRVALGLRQGLNSKDGGKTPFGRFRGSMYDVLAKGNYDFRSNKLAHDIGHQVKVDFGHGQHGGYEHIAHERDEKLEKYGKGREHNAEQKSLLGAAAKETNNAKEAAEEAKKKYEAHAEGEDTASATLEEQLKTATAAAATAQKTNQDRFNAQEQVLAKADADLKAAQEQRAASSSNLAAYGVAKAAEEKAEKDRNEAAAALEVIKEQNEAQAERDKINLEAQQEALRVSRENFTTLGKTLSKAVKDKTEAFELQKAAEVKLKADLSPIKAFTEQLAREQANPIIRMLPGSEGVTHAIHNLDKHANSTENERLMKKLADSIDRAGKATADATRSLEREIDENARRAAGDSTDDQHATGGGDGHH